MIPGDVFFTPEVYWDGMYWPVCFEDMEGAESVADAVCLAAGFNGGVRVVKVAGKIFDRDAMPVAMPFLPSSLLFLSPPFVVFITPFFAVCQCKLRKCAPGESLSSCLKAENEVGMEISTKCKAGNAVGVEIACNYQVGHDVLRNIIRTSSYAPARALPSLYFFNNAASVDHFLNSTKRTWLLAIHS